MSNMNVLGFPMWDHQRVDGRYLKTIGCIDFRNHSESIAPRVMSVDDIEQPLLPGTIFGSFIRYRWRQRKWHTRDGKRRASHPSTRLHLQGYYTGQNIETDLIKPGSKNEQPAILPELWLWRPPYKLDIGQIAIAHLCEGERAAIKDISLDHQAIMHARGIEPSTDNPRPYLGAVQYGGLYIVPPLDIG